MDWSDLQKEEMREVLTGEFMSSEDTDYPDSDNEEEVVYKVKKFPWESRLLSLRKKTLDEVGKCNHRVKRVRNGDCAKRKKPSSCPAWALKKKKREKMSLNAN